MLAIEELENLMGTFSIIRQVPGQKPLREAVSINFHVWMLKVWAALRILPVITWQELLESCTAGMAVDGLPVNIEDPTTRVKIERNIDGALASLCRVGLISLDRAEKDGLVVPGGDTAMVFKELAEIRQRRAEDLRIERARLEYRLNTSRAKNPRQNPQNPRQRGCDLWL